MRARKEKGNEGLRLRHRSLFAASLISSSISLSGEQGNLLTPSIFSLLEERASERASETRD